MAGRSSSSVALATVSPNLIWVGAAHFGKARTARICEEGGKRSRARMASSRGPSVHVRTMRRRLTTIPAGMTRR